MKSTLKAIFLVYLFFHLIVMLLMPNSASLLNKNFSDIILPYANAIGLNVSWQFFSPDPANTMYLEYRIFYENEYGEETKESAKGIYPEDGGVNSNISSRRLVYSMRFFLMDNNRLKFIFAPYLCRKFPGATRVRVDRVIVPIPALESAMNFDESRLLKPRDEMQMAGIERNCLENDEEEL